MRGSKRTNLQAMRRRAGFKSAREFAEYIGVPKDTYTKYEQGSAKMTLLQAWEFADKLHCSLDELAGRDWSPHNAELSHDERHLVDTYRDTDARGKRTIMRTAEGEAGVEGQSENVERRAI